MVKKSSSKTVGSFLDGNNNQLNTILSKAQMLNEMNDRVLPLIDAHLRAYCRVANYNQQILTLVAANGSVATQLRFQSSTLLRKFKQDDMLGRIKSINCKVNPGFNQQPNRLSRRSSISHQVARLSEQTASMVANIAETLSLPALKEVMKRIAGRRK